MSKVKIIYFFSLLGGKKLGGEKMCRTYTHYKQYGNFAVMNPCETAKVCL